MTRCKPLCIEAGGQAPAFCARTGYVRVLGRDLRHVATSMDRYAVATLCGVWRNLGEPTSWLVRDDGTFEFQTQICGACASIARKEAG